jgi:hypothetical protein
VGVLIRPTIPSDLPAVIGEPLPFRVRTVTLLVDDEVKAIGGLAFPPDGPVCAFMQQTDDLKRYPIAIHRAGFAGMALIRESGLREIVATAESANTKALRWLRHFGFVESHQQPVDGKVIFFWVRPCDTAP